MDTPRGESVGGSAADQPDAAAFRALARSSPWRRRSVHLQRQRAGEEPPGPDVAPVTWGLGGFDAHRSRMAAVTLILLAVGVAACQTSDNPSEIPVGDEVRLSDTQSSLCLPVTAEEPDLVYGLGVSNDGDEPVELVSIDAATHHGATVEGAFIAPEGFAIGGLLGWPVDDAEFAPYFEDGTYEPFPATLPPNPGPEMQNIVIRARIPPGASIDGVWLTYRVGEQSKEYRTEASAYLVEGEDPC